MTNATFGVAPAGLRKHGKSGPDGRSYFSFNSTPGGTNTDHIAITNYTRRPEHLSVYTVDAVPATDGAISFPLKSAKRLQAGAWMAVGTPSGKPMITVRPRSAIVLPVHVSVPKNASPGDHVGAVVVSLTGRAGAKFGGGSQEKVNFEQRIAVQAAFRITGPLHPRLAIVGLGASYSGPVDPFSKGSATVRYKVHNGGNVVLGGPQVVTVHGLFGESVTGPELVNLPPLLPGATYGPITAHINSVYPEILMSAKVTVTPQGLQGQVLPHLAVVSSSVHFWAMPWVILGVALLLLLLVLLLLWRRRRRKARAAEPSGKHRLSPTPQGV